MTAEPIQELFRAAAGRFAERPAVEWPEGSASYAQLARRADELAAELVAAGVEPGTLVAVLASRSVDVIAAMLGTLQAGAAFAPLDPHYGLTRLEAAAAELAPRWWLVDPVHADAFARCEREAAGAASIALGPGWWERPAGTASPAAERRGGGPDALAYVYLTSGSTGRPKGIAGRLKAIDHFIRWEIETFGLAAGVRVSQLTTPAFDAFLRDAFVPLLCGGTVCAPGDRGVLLDGARLLDWLDRERVNLLHCTPSLFRSLLAQELDGGRLASLRHVLLAGEQLLPADVRRWHAVFGDRIQLVNLYGPSETTMTKLYHVVRPEDGEARTVPIGRPMAGAKAIVVDEGLQPCPPGRLGEILIRTPYRSLGYYRRPDLTAEVFVQNPFSDRPDDIVYRTGDLGRMRDDGSFEYVGRRDAQVKVRGLRLELAPIEDLLRSHPSVADAAIVDRLDGQGNRFLCAYVVLRQPVETAVLETFLRERLAEAVAPSGFVFMQALPRTLSGKVDRRALPDPAQVWGRDGAGYVAPRTPVEESLCTIFAGLLGLPRVGIRDSFFQLGGHSLLATQMLARIRSVHGVEVPLGQVFHSPTVEGLAETVVRLQLRGEDEEEIARMMREIRGLSTETLEESIGREAGGGAPGAE